MIDCMHLKLPLYAAASSAVGLVVDETFIHWDVFACDFVFKANLIVEMNIISLMFLNTVNSEINFLIDVIFGHSMHDWNQLCR